MPAAVVGVGAAGRGAATGGSARHPRYDPALRLGARSEQWACARPSRPGSSTALDLVGIFVFAISGALLAVRKNFDVFGIAVLAEVTALGGGLFRDLVIGAVPPAAFTDLGYFLTPLIAAGSSSSCTRRSSGSRRRVNVFDAAGLGLFCVTGTVKAYDYGLGLTASAALGLATAAGGGVLRDVLANEVPSLLRWDRDLYAVPAIVGATMVAAAASASTR